MIQPLLRPFREFFEFWINPANKSQKIAQKFKSKDPNSPELRLYHGINLAEVSTQARTVLTLLASVPPSPPSLLLPPPSRFSFFFPSLSFPPSFSLLMRYHFSNFPFPPPSYPPSLLPFPVPLLFFPLFPTLSPSSLSSRSSLIKNFPFPPSLPPSSHVPLLSSPFFPPFLFPYRLFLILSFLSLLYFSLISSLSPFSFFLSPSRSSLLKK
jgi:hypothetical protein